MANTSSKLAISGRILLALYFLLPGIMKLLATDMHVTLMQHHNIPNALPLLYIAGFVQIIGALFLMANRHVRNVCLGFALYILIINFTLHGFWNFTDIEAQHETQNFIKNMGILAGVLILAGHSVKRKIPFSLKELLSSDKKS
ncbi:MAG: hypothetical protein COA43_05795 [Robiginitomaculum sp.]|nr:MAG: hypothetical protein COA43_05795 [Robiginitomaculum sp.]